MVVNLAILQAVGGVWQFITTIGGSAVESLKEQLWEFFIEFIGYLISLLTGPINKAILDFINDYIPGLNTALVYAGNFLSEIGNYIGFSLSYLGFYPEVVTICISLIAGIVTIPVIVHAIKIAVKWWHALAP